ncbi:MAG: outer membrane beta-barrel protein [Tannerella sp.]|jgi:opacity protein-like surface antigen|nr:outer membrane beta-barrel protein [Tannerella sp.]
MKTDKTKKQSPWEEAVRSKLKDCEAETAPEDWKAIADRLPEMRKPSIPFHVRRYAAAAIALLLMSAGGYFYQQQRKHTHEAAELTETPSRETAHPDAPNHPSIPSAVAPSSSLVAGALPGKRTRTLPAPSPAKEKKSPVEEVTREQILPADPPVADETPETPPAQPSAEEPARTQIEPAEDSHISTLLAVAPSVSPRKRSQKRWGIGMGGGSYSIGANEGGYGGMNLRMSEHSLVYNAEAPPRPMLRSDGKKHELSHKYPLSFGLGVSYALNDRWALQSGLTYTLLRSEWITISDSPGEVRQQLHFIGLPLSVNYKIAEWNRFRLYATGGILTEWNVSGQIRTDYLNGGEKIRTEKESIRMKDWLWSINARTGVSYPLVRFLNAYVEGGACYYFDNGSSIETIRSDKPFHVSLQAGIRLGF